MRRSAVLGAIAWTGALWLAVPAAAQVVRIDELRPLRSDATVEIEVVTHHIVVVGWDRNEIQIVGQYDASFDELDIEASDRSFTLEIDQENDRRNRRGGDPFRLEVRVPRGVGISLETVSGTIQIEGLTGSVEAASVAGRVALTGNLDAVDLESVAGTVSYSGNAPHVELTSVSSGVEYSGRADRVQLQSVSGSVRMDGAAASIEVESVSGQVRITSTVPVRSLEIGTVSGRVSFDGRLASGASVDVETHTGTIELLLDTPVDARFDLSTFSGSLSSNLPNARDERRTRARFTPEESLSFETGTGSGRVIVRSFSGSVRIVDGGE